MKGNTDFYGTLNKQACLNCYLAPPYIPQHKHKLAQIQIIQIPSETKTYNFSKTNSQTKTLDNETRVPTQTLTMERYKTGDAIKERKRIIKVNKDHNEGS